MTNFNGWHIKFGNNLMNEHFILEDGWQSTPNQRLENAAYRNANADLRRETADHTKSSIIIKIKPLRLAQKQELDSIISLATLSKADKLQRRVVCTYWNDEDMRYTTGTFYMPDIQYTHKRTTQEDIMYNEFEIHLVEY